MVTLAVVLCGPAVMLQVLWGHVMAAVGADLHV